jgi:hypothetical protein
VAVCTDVAQGVRIGEEERVGEGIGEEIGEKEGVAEENGVGEGIDSEAVWLSSSFTTPSPIAVLEEMKKQKNSIPCQ